MASKMITPKIIPKTNSRVKPKVNANRQLKQSNDSASKSMGDVRVSLSGRASPLTLNSQIPKKTVNEEEYRKILARNDSLARENAILKENVRKLRNEITNREANDTNKKMHNSLPMTSDGFTTVLNALLKEYDNIRTKVTEFGNSLDIIKMLTENCSSLIRAHFSEIPNSTAESDYVTIEEFTQIFNESNGQMSASLINPNQSRYSLTPEDRESMRQMSWRKYKNAFHVFSELSTIMELSREIRMSLGPASHGSQRSGSGGLSESIIFQKNPIRKSSIRPQPNVSIIDEIESDENGRSRESEIIASAYGASKIHSISNGSSNDLHESRTQSVNENDLSKLAFSAPLCSSSPSYKSHTQVTDTSMQTSLTNECRIFVQPEMTFPSNGDIIEPVTDDERMAKKRKNNSNEAVSVNSRVNDTIETIRKSIRKSKSKEIENDNLLMTGAATDLQKSPQNVLLQNSGSDNDVPLRRSSRVTRKRKNYAESPNKDEDIMEKPKVRRKRTQTVKKKLPKNGD